MNSPPARSTSTQDILRQALHSPWAWSALALAVAAAVLNSVPPFRDIHYEFSAASALALSLLPCALIVLRRPRTEPAPLERDATRALLLTLVPLLVALLALPFRNDTCLGEGPLWYLLLVPPSALISVAVGRIAEAVVPQRRWLRSFLLVLLWGGSLGRGAWEALTGPHIFLYCWQIGFFPGGSWDPFIPIPDRLIFYRLAHLLVAAGLLVVAEMWRGRHRERHTPVRLGPLATGALALAVIVPVLLGFRIRLGLTSSDAWVEEQLGDVIRTRWSTVVTNRAAVDSLSLNVILAEVDQDVEEYARVLGTRPETFAPVRIVLYPNAAERERLVGSRWVAYTKPWRGEMHITPQSRGVMRHELGHLAMAPSGNILGITLAQGLLEGSAEALGGEWGTLPLEEYVVAMRQLAPNPVELMTSGGFTGSTSASYVASGAFCRWLIDQYGGPRFRALFAAGDFEEAYGVPLDSLARRYSAHIDSLRNAAPLGPRPDPVAVNYLFGGGSFFQQRCLRALGALNAQADAAFGAGRYERALELAREAADLGGSNSTSSMIVRTLAAMGRYNEVRDSLKKYILKDSANSLFVAFPTQLLPLEVEFGDALWRMGEPERAASLYRQVADLRLSASLSIRALARWASATSPNADTRSQMLRYFTSTMSTARRVAWLGDVAAKTSDEDLAVILALLRAQLVINEAPVTTVQQLIDDGTLFRASRLVAASTFTSSSQASGELVTAIMVELAPALFLHDRLAPTATSAWDIVDKMLWASQVPAVHHMKALRNGAAHR